MYVFGLNDVVVFFFRHGVAVFGLNDVVVFFFRHGVAVFGLNDVVVFFFRHGVAVFGLNDVVVFFFRHGVAVFGLIEGCSRILLQGCRLWLTLHSLASTALHWSESMKGNAHVVLTVAQVVVILISILVCIFLDMLNSLIESAPV